MKNSAYSGNATIPATISLTRAHYYIYRDYPENNYLLWVMWCRKQSGKKVPIDCERIGDLKFWQEKRLLEQLCILSALSYSLNSTIHVEKQWKFKSNLQYTDWNRECQSNSYLKDEISLFSTPKTIHKKYSKLILSTVECLMAPYGFQKSILESNEYDQDLCFKLEVSPQYAKEFLDSEQLAALSRISEYPYIDSIADEVFADISYWADSQHHVDSVDTRFLEILCDTKGIAVGHCEKDYDGDFTLIRKTREITFKKDGFNDLSPSLVGVVLGVVMAKVLKKHTNTGEIFRISAVDSGFELVSVKKRKEERLNAW